MPESCCIVGCTNRRSKESDLPFYSIPKGKTPFEKRRRIAWIKAVNRKDWEGWSEDKISKQKICGEHFLKSKSFMAKCFLDVYNKRNTVI